ncbi:MAG: dihydrolipoyl dehydrogenase [Nitrospirae bacterium]|nr:dihydrolipoyl dehydrogenase [Nitrospirota bacterium]
MDMRHTDLAVLGAGPGGYAAAFYAADRGKKVILVDRNDRPGGICLHHGCIPSKALLHAVRILSEAKSSAARGIYLGHPRIDLDRLRAWKDLILDKLGRGVEGLARKRGVEFIAGRGHFEDSETLRVETAHGQEFIRYTRAIIAVGSKPAMPSEFDLGNERVMTSTEALQLPEIPARLLVVGGGYIGMELGTVFAALGSRVVLAEALPSLLSGADPDLVRPVAEAARAAFEEVRLGAKVLKLGTSGRQIRVTMEAGGKKLDETFDRVLVSVGREPHCLDLGLESTRVGRDDRGFIQVDARQRTSDPRIQAVGDAVGGVLLAHKAAKQGRIAVDDWLGENVTFENVVIPAVVFTDPEVAWCGLTEHSAQQKGIAVTVAKFPWSASGRALTYDRPDGLTKLVIEPDTERILGVGIVGVGAGDLIGEGVLAVEMGATARDLTECVHPHPTLSETLMESAEAFFGTATHTFIRPAGTTEGAS